MTDITVSVSLDQLHWTTREGVAATLIAIANGAPGEAARRALILLRGLATPAIAPHLLRLACRRDRIAELRERALEAFAATDSEAPDEVIAALLDEQPSDRPSGELPPLSDIVRLARTASQRRLVCDFLDRAGHPVLTALLSTYLDDDAIAAHARARWLAGIDPAGPSEDDARVVGFLRDVDAASARVRGAYWRARRGDDEAGFREALRYDGAMILPTLDRAERVAAARRLDMRLGDLIEPLGPAALAGALSAAVMAYSFHLRCPVDRESDTEPRHKWALSLLGEWREGPAVVLRLLRRAVLHPAVEIDLAETLAWSRRDWGRRWLATLMHDPARLPQIRAIVRILSREPEPADREVLRAALALPDVEVRCLAIESLDALDEDGAVYRDILRALAGRAEPILQLCAARALARRGEARFAAVVFAACTDPDENLRAFALSALASLARHPDLREACVAALVDSALVEPETWLRAEAVGCLARLPSAADHLALFEQLLLDDPGRVGHYDLLAPVCDNAALALGVVGGERARACLLRAAFVVSSSRFVAIATAIDVLMACPDGTPAERLARLRDWGERFRRARYFFAAREVEDLG